MYEEMFSLENLELAFRKARKGKTTKQYIAAFEKELQWNLRHLQNELLSKTYKPKPLETFILRDPKTRKISKSDFRDRIVHHALCNIIEPIFDKIFIYDSYANRKNKGTLKAIIRLDKFIKKVSKNNTRQCYVLKADVRHYFESVNHSILLSIIQKKIKDDNVIWLIKTILNNHNTKLGIGMPLGNLTSQFFANVYLNELDQFVKHNLKAKYYIRYVDDFVILHSSKSILKHYKEHINRFLQNTLQLELHPDKSVILTLNNGIGFLGFRVFFYHKLIKKKNLNKFQRKFQQFKLLYKERLIEREKIVDSLEGWLAYTSYASTYKYRKHLIRQFNYHFPIREDTEIINVKKHENFIKKVAVSNYPFSSQKTLFLFNKGLNIKEIAEKRNIKEATVWEHLSKLIERNQLSVWKVLPKEKVVRILMEIKNSNDLLRDIKQRINEESITFNETNCVLAHVRCKAKRKAAD